MEDIPVGVGPLPVGGGVGGEAGVDQSQGGPAVRVGKVGVELPQLAHQEHPLVHNGPAGEGGHIGAGVGPLKDPAGQVQLPVKVQSLFAARRTLDEALANVWHTVPGFLTQNFRVGGHVPPTQELHALLGHNDFQHFLSLGPLQPVGGHEEHAHTVIPLLPQGDALLSSGLGHELMGDLNHQAHAVPRLAGGVLARPVLQLFHDFQGVVHRLIGLDSLDADHSADAAGVVLRTIAWIRLLVHTVSSFGICTGTVSPTDGRGDSRKIISARPGARRNRSHRFGP